MPNLHNIRAGVAAHLRAAGIPDAAQETAYLLALALNCDRAALLMDRELSAAEVEHINALAARRAGGEPLDRLRGSREFYGLNFGLNTATLSPRADTEALVELALGHCLPPERGKYPAQRGEGGDNLSILDLGTGTGCILLSLLHTLPHATGTGVDVSPDALAQAQQNAKALGITRATFMQSDWFQNVHGTFDLIISNPPYIPAAVVPTLAREVRDFDPRAALNGGADGLGCYRVIFTAARAHLKPQGRVMVEIGAGQGADVKAIAAAHGFTCSAEKVDLAGILRALAFE